MRKQVNPAPGGPGDMLRIGAGVVGLVVLLGIVVAAWDGFRTWLDKRRFEEERVSIPVSASVTGSLLANAAKSCNVFSVTTLEQCAAVKGELPQELIAPVMAQAAIESRREYYAKCMRHREAQDCQGLLNRAVQIAAKSS